MVGDEGAATSLASGTYAALMEPEMQTMIDAIMVRNGVDTGIGNYNWQDVRQHLQEKALIALRRFDGSVKPSTFLWRRLNGACLDLLRRQGVRNARGNLRMTHPENLVYIGALVSVMEENPDQAGATAQREAYDGDDDDAAAELNQACDAADLTLALSQLPPRQRAIMYLLYYEMHTPEETARRLCMTTDLLREIRDAALLKLRLALVERIDTGPPMAIRFSPVRHSS